MGNEMNLAEAFFLIFNIVTLSNTLTASIITFCIICKFCDVLVTSHHQKPNKTQILGYAMNAPQLRNYMS